MITAVTREDQQTTKSPNPITSPDLPAITVDMLAARQNGKAAAQSFTPSSLSAFLQGEQEVKQSIPEKLFFAEEEELSPEEELEQLAAQIRACGIGQELAKPDPVEAMRVLQEVPEWRREWLSPEEELEWVANCIKASGIGQELAKPDPVAAAAALANLQKSEPWTDEESEEYHRGWQAYEEELKALERADAERDELEWRAWAEELQASDQSDTNKGDSIKIYD